MIRYVCVRVHITHTSNRPTEILNYCQSYYMINQYKSDIYKQHILDMWCTPLILKSLVLK